ncbi:MAG: polyphosphate kinase 2 family protein [Bacteroidales bacterium]
MAMSIDRKLKAPIGKKIKLSEYKTNYTGQFKDKQDATDLLQNSIMEMRELQEKLYADGRYSLLIIFQAMDAAGKDGTIKHVMSGINPQGCDVVSFKQPSAQELKHDYLWRNWCQMPERGRIGIFNRSYYEEVLVTKVHPEIILTQNLPHVHTLKEVNEAFFTERYRQINNMEKHWIDNGKVIIKFFLHLSKDEQKKRFLDRIDNPSKNWKFSASDLKEREHWDAYQAAFEKAISATSTTEAPWYIIPADKKWFMRASVSHIIVETLKTLNLQYPKISKEGKAQLLLAKAQLENESEK